MKDNLLSKYISRLQHSKPNIDNQQIIKRTLYPKVQVQDVTVDGKSEFRISSLNPPKGDFSGYVLTDTNGTHHYNWLNGASPLNYDCQYRRTETAYKNGATNIKPMYIVYAPAHDVGDLKLLGKVFNGYLQDEKDLCRLTNDVSGIIKID